MTASTTTSADAARRAWHNRVLRVGGIIQACFAAFWLVRGSLAVGGPLGSIMAVTLGLTALAALAYGVRVTSGLAPRPTGDDGKRIERAVTIATVVELVASFAFPAIVIAAGHADMTLPSIAITIGPLLLWLDYRLDIPLYRPVGWALTIGPVVLAILLSGDTLAATTGLSAGVLMIATAIFGFHQLAEDQGPRLISSTR
jgi:hypothetical protein